MMRSRFFWHCRLLQGALLVLMLLDFMAPAHASRRALVIGNDSYETVKQLKNARNDAVSMAAELEKAGFTVSLHRDLKRDMLFRVVESFADLVRKEDEVVFYFSGHGVQIGAPYLLPVDILANSDKQVMRDALALDEVVGLLSKARYSLLMIDACRDNPFPKSVTKGVGGERGLAPVETPEGTAIMLAAGRGQQALDRLGANDVEKNGLFIRELLKHIRTPGLSVRDLLVLVRDGVEETAATVQHKQRPSLQDESRGSFYFYAPGSPINVTPVPASLPARPGNAGFSLDDIKQQQAARSQWAKWQTEMRAAFEQTAQLDAAPDLKAAAWQRFLSSYAQDNPYSADGKSLRAQATKLMESALADVRRQQAEAARPAFTPTTLGAALRGRAGTVFRDCADCPEMVVIPKGSFLMGSPESESGRSSSEITTRDLVVSSPESEKSVRSPDEGPQHRVSMDMPFALGKYSVTFAEWDACVKAGGCRGYRPTDAGWGRGTRPVINVSWEDGQAYAQWLSEKTGKGYRLPSEAEWEYAARAGMMTARYWGEAIGVNQANCNGCGSQWDNKQTAPVGSFSANGFGLYDMLGNVWQWTQDCWHENYAGAPVDGGAWTTGCKSDGRGLRGGSWYVYASNTRAAYRDNSRPGIRNKIIGFRLARTLP